MTQIDYFFSLASPFTYLAGGGLEDIAKKHRATINYKPCDMAHVFSQTGGLPPAKRHPSRQEYRLQELARLSKAAGLPLKLHPKFWPTDPTAASLTVLAGGELKGVLAQAFLKACWAEDRDISNPITIAEVVASVAGSRGSSILTDAPAHRKEFNGYTAEALDRGVFGAPFYIVGDERFWGQDRLSYLDLHLSGS